VSDIQPLAYWQDYLQHGFFPFYLEGRDTYKQRLENVINLVLDVDIPQCTQIDLKYIPRIKKLLYMIAVSAPMKPNISKLSAAIEVSRQTISQYLEYLKQAALINLIRSDKRGHGMLTKPEKILLHNANLAHTIALENSHTGTMRETFFVNQVSPFHDVKIPESGDFVLDAHWTFEVGGRAKTGRQLRKIKKAYIAADDIETGHDRQIPLWLFGFLS
jgi:predicted AAA+ superfamily ATPase